MPISPDSTCFHCGDVCKEDVIKKDEKLFCCSGCLFVHELINDNNLDDYYKLAQKTGIKPKSFDKSEFSFLDDKEVQDKLLQFSIDGVSKITLFIPEIYCSACIWLLENLSRLDKGILESKVNFLKKEISITFNSNNTSLRKIIELLTSIGYKPKLNLSDIESKNNSSINKSLFLKLGVAGFAFGNIMLFAFPEYLSGGTLEPELKRYFGYLSLLIALGCLYAGSDFFKSAWASLKLKYINIDVPLSLGILVLFVRSAYDILMGIGPGYTDSLAGLVFFLLIGRVFRQKTFHSLSFDRDYKSYFPLSVLRKKDNKEDFVSLKEIKIGDKLIVRNNEIIPCDSLLSSQEAKLDYSFVTGESKDINVKNNEKIFAGGINKGSAIEIISTKIFSQSYITELWNHKTFQKNESKQTLNISDSASKYFTFVVIAIALISLFYWLPSNLNTALNAFTAVLIIACPCAFSLALPFSYGTTLRIFSKNNFFLKNDNVVEKLSQANAIVFDKTGTLTNTAKSKLEYSGKNLNEEEKALIKSCSKNSTHPISRLIYQHFECVQEFEIKDFKETTGNGVEASFNNINIKIGKKSFVETILNRATNANNIQLESTVYISINNEIYGYFTVKPSYRANISSTLKYLSNKFKIIILSGDNDSEKANLIEMSGANAEIHFNKIPIEKLEFIEKLQAERNKTIMIGDGLNDAGALKQSDVGIAISDESSNFTPGSDAILYGDDIERLPQFLKLSKQSVNTVYLCFAISIAYNLFGLYFAVKGDLTPILAAIFMPISSISIMLIAVLKVKYNAYRLKLK